MGLHMRRSVNITPEKNVIAPIEPSEMSVVERSKTADEGSISLSIDRSSSGASTDAADYEKKVGFFQLFRFADALDIVMMVFGSLCAVAVGAAFPVNVYFFGDMITQFVVTQQSTSLNESTVARILNSTDVRLSCYRSAAEKKMASMMSSGYPSSLTNANASMLAAGIGYSLPYNVTTAASTTTTAQTLLEVVVDRYVKAFCGIGGGVLVCGYLGMSLWMLATERQVLRLRLAYFRSLVRQEISWFDTHEIGELNTRMVNNVHLFHGGLGDKMATFLQWMSTFIGGFIVGIVQGWKLALIIVAVTPLLVIAAILLDQALRKFVHNELAAYAKAGAIATEVLTAIKTVTAFGGQSKAIEKYKSNLGAARTQGIWKTALTGAMSGIIWFFVFGSFALAYWYGAKLVREDCLEAGIILQVFFGVLVGAMSLGEAVPLLENFSNARGAAATLFEVIDHKSIIDSSSETGEKPNAILGRIEYSDVNFRYPARPDVQILRGMSLTVEPGQTVALVGSSGCGKSTLIQLLQRFYDPLEGEVRLDGVDIRMLNLGWLRSHIGIVGQEPVLFGTTIEENIRLGNADASMEDVERAAKEANCFDFINKLPQKFQTIVGERGAQLSGGQKQRIAIARAIIGNPKILLLDEATSALDTESEALVQAALDKAREGRSTIIVAHRLSTVRNADVIFALKDGAVVEFGAHQQLIEKRGLYYFLSIQQQGEAESDKLGADLETTNLPAANDAATSSIPGVSRSLSLEQRSHLREQLAQRRRSKRRRTLSVGTESSKEHPGLRSLREAAPTLLRVASIDEGQPIHGKLSSEDWLEPQPAPVSMWRVFSLNKPEAVYIVFGCIGSLLAGCVQPSFAIIMSEIFGVFGFTLDPDEQEQKIAFWSGMMVVIGASAALVIVLEGSMFAISGERLTERIRLLSFSAMLRQEMGWFDDQRNRVGALTTQLASDASSVKGATGSRAGVIIQSLSTLLFALIVSFVYVWKLTLVLMIFFPLTVAGGLVQGKLMQGYAAGEKRAVEQGGIIAQEVIGNMRTVAGLCKESYFVDKFASHFNALFKRDRVKALVSGLAYSSSQSIFFFCYAVCFSYGAYLVDTEDVKFFYILRVFSAITFGGMTVGRATASAPDYTKAKVAANKLFELLDRQSTIDSSDSSGIQLPECTGEIKFSQVAFAYPTRSTVPILRNVTVEVLPGERLALVGSSGCGKSTSVSLLQRFYEPLSGALYLDGHELRTLNLQSLRGHLGMVSQEPILFDDTIAANIAYGDNTRDVPMDEIIEAARKANIHDFIVKLPQGYDTNVGDKGTQLSGGQKQRIAIARALLRNPKVLLLDEATSALDTESERVVQEALAKAQEGRTCVIVAHRLSTVRTASKIAVMHNGRVAEIGTHEQLLAARGLYFNLINAQLF